MLTMEDRHRRCDHRVRRPALLLFGTASAVHAPVRDRVGVFGALDCS